MATLADLLTTLADIEAAELRLALGEQATTVREADGSTVIYAQPSAAALLTMRRRVEEQIAALKGTTGIKRAPIYVQF